MGKKVIIWAQPSLDFIFGTLDEFPNLGAEKRVEKFDFQVGGGPVTYASFLSRMGVETDFYTLRSNKSPLFDVYEDMIKKYGITNINYIDVDYDPIYYTSVLSFQNDRSFVAHTKKLECDKFNPTIPQIFKDAEYCYLNYELLDYFEFKDNQVVFFDVGSIESENTEKVIETLKKINYFIPNDVEALSITKQKNISEALENLNKYVDVPIISLGSRGIAVLIDGKKYRVFNSRKVNAIDSTGAGDNLLAGFMYGIIKNLNPLDALKIGIANATISVENLGSYGHLATIEEIETEIKTIKVEEYND